MGRSAVELVDEMWRRVTDDDDSALDELVSPDLVNHAAGPQGLAGLRGVLAVLDHDLGPLRAEHLHLFGSGDLATHHVTMHGTHSASTMPLLQGIAPTGKPVAWTFNHVWRAEKDLLVEHWACRDDVGLLAQLGGLAAALTHADINPIETDQIRCARRETRAHGMTPPPGGVMLLRR